MRYNYYGNIVWIVDWVLLIIIAITAGAALLYAMTKNYLWEKRRRGLLYIKRNVYELLLAGSHPSDSACQLFIASITPQQFIDIVTNRSKDAVFFNEAEQKFLKHCFVTPQQLARLERIASHSINKWLRIEAMLCLGYTQKEEAVDMIKRSLSSGDRDIAYFSMISLGHIRTVGSGRALLKRLKKDTLNSYKIISILEGFPESITRDVAELTGDRDPAVRRNAAMLLSKFDTSHYAKELKRLVRDDSPEVRAAACDCLAADRSDKAGAAKMLKECLKDGNWLVRARAVFALERLMGAKAVDEVMDMMNDASWSVLDALRSVMIAHIEAAIPYIEKFLAGDYDIAKKYAIAALQGAALKDMDALTRDKVSKLLEEIESAAKGKA